MVALSLPPLPPLSASASGRRLILHIGHSKTGSTAIQDVLARNQVRVPGKVLLYPAHRNHMPLAKSLAGTAPEGERAARFSRLRDVLDRASWDVAVISSEQFEFVPPQAVRAAFEEFLAPYLPLLQIIVYVRPHVPRLVANHGEHLKLGFSFDGLEGDLDLQRQRGLLFYADRLSRWRAVFADQLLVRPFLPEAFHRGDVVADFLRLACDSEAVEVDAAAGAVNASLSLQDLSVLREIHMRIHARNPALWQKQEAWAWDAAGFLGALPPVAAPVRPMIDRALLAKVQAVFAEDARRFDALFWDGPLFAPALENADAIGAPLPIEAAAWHGPETLRLIHAFADMLAHVMEAGAQPLLRAIQPAWAR